MRSPFTKHRGQVVVAILLVAMLLSITACAPAQTELQSRITNLERKLSTAESTIKVLEHRIEELERAPQKSITEADILRTLQGKEYWASVGGRAMKIWFGECTSLGE